MTFPSPLLRGPNFNPLSGILPDSMMWVKSLPVADKALLRPENALAYFDGEWVVESSSKLVRAADVATTGAVATSSFTFPIWGSRGRSDWQANPNGKIAEFYMGDWEAETRIFDKTAVVGSGLAITAVGQGLKVATITDGSRKYVGLVGHGGGGVTDPVACYVAALSTTHPKGFLRIRKRKP